MPLEIRELIWYRLTATSAVQLPSNLRPITKAQGCVLCM